MRISNSKNVFAMWKIDIVIAESRKRAPIQAHQYSSLLVVFFLPSFSIMLLNVRFYCTKRGDWTWCFLPIRFIEIDNEWTAQNDEPILINSFYTKNQTKMRTIHSFIECLLCRKSYIIVVVAAQVRPMHAIDGSESIGIRRDRD